MKTPEISGSAARAADAMFPEIGRAWAAMERKMAPHPADLHRLRNRIADTVRGIDDSNPEAAKAGEGLLEMLEVLDRRDANNRQARDMKSRLEGGAALTANRSSNPIAQAFGRSPDEARRNLDISAQWLRASLLGDQGAAENLNSATGISPQAALGGQGGLSSGGVLVPDELANAIITLQEEYGVARRECTVMTMGSDSLDVPILSSDATAYYVGEADEITDSSPSFGQAKLVSKKLAARTVISTELLEDSAVDVGMTIADSFARQLAKAEDSALFNGDGTSTYGGIQGIRTQLITGTKAGAVTAAAGHDTLTEIDADDLLGLMSVLPLYAHANAKWYCSPRAMQLVFNALASGAGGVTMMETGTVQLRSYLGYPIVQSPEMPNTTGDLSGQVMILFGDMRLAALMGERRMFRMRRDDFSRMKYDQVVLQGTQRYDIVAHGVGDASTAGPMVGLVGE